jgi:murein DD-endopeptidase
MNIKNNKEINYSASSIGFETVYYPVAEDILVYHEFGWGGSHKGVDWIIPVGTPVPNMQDGTIYESAEDSKTYGRYIMILHNNGYASLYAHLSKLYERKKGTIVYAGKIIGLSGGVVGAPGSGASQGYHLHFEVRPPININYNWFNIDPIAYLEEHNAIYL